MNASPFKQHTANNLTHVGPLATWLADMVRTETSIAVALKERSKKLALASRDDAWEVDLKSAAAPLLLSVVRTSLIDQQQQHLLCRNLGQDMVDLTRFFVRELALTPEAVFYSLLPQFVGDLTSAGQVIGHEVLPASRFKKAMMDAAEVALLEPQYAESSTSKYYAQVAMPLQKIFAEAVVFKQTTPPTWWVSYDKLWVKVLAYFTDDPTLTMAFNDRRDPFEVVSKVLKCTEEVAEVVLLWQACGRDITVFTRRFPARVQDLPQDIADYEQRLDKSLVNLCLGCVHMQTAYFQTRSATTLYGRRLRPGQPTGEAVAFRIFGTVEELVANATVTLHNWRPSREVKITGLKGGPAAETTRIEGHGPQMQLVGWLDTAKELATLVTELQPIALAPQVVLV